MYAVGQQGSKLEVFITPILLDGDALHWAWSGKSGDGGWRGMLGKPQRIEMRGKGAQPGAAVALTYLGHHGTTLP